MRCIISLVFILKLGKIVIVKEENSPVKGEFFYAQYLPDFLIKMSPDLKC